jgi:hypothetical protein
MNINIHYVWVVIITWSAAALLAMVFVRGAHRNKFKGE